jgi:hypothetical protein
VTIADPAALDSDGGSLQWKPAISNVVHPTHRGHAEALSWHIWVRRRRTVCKSVVPLLRKSKDVLGMAYSQFIGGNDIQPKSRIPGMIGLILSRSCSDLPV